MSENRKSVVSSLMSQGFSNVLIHEPGSIQIAANHQSGVSIWFYSKHSVAILRIYDKLWTYIEGSFDDVLASLWDFLPEDARMQEEYELDLSQYKGGDMGGLLDDEELQQFFQKMWDAYTFTSILRRNKNDLGNF